LEPLKVVWFNGSLTPFEKATCSVLAHGLNYGTGVFEGIRAYTVTDGRKVVFRLDDHMARFIASAKMLGLKVPYTQQELSKAVKQMLEANPVQSDVYIRPIAFVGLGGINLDFRKFKVDVAVAGLTFDNYFGGDKAGLRVCTSSWRRIGQSGLLPLAKATGNYLNSCLAKCEAGRNGYDEAIFLDENGLVSEGTGENLFIVYHRKLITPPLSSSILDGITRDTCIKMAEKIGYKVVENTLTRGELLRAEEVFFTGTAAGLMPVVEVDGVTIGSGEEGEITKKLRSEYDAVVKGQRIYEPNWLTWIEYKKAQEKLTA
jgi:branched-chain amino acid aminotransferase